MPSEVPISLDILESASIRVPDSWLRKEEADLIKELITLTDHLLHARPRELPGLGGQEDAQGFSSDPGLEHLHVPPPSLESQQLIGGRSRVQVGSSGGPGG